MMTANQCWKDIKEDSKEKYNLYLCSREWGLLKKRVRERAGGKCERCKVNEMEACHHLTYERKYKERLEDLQAICKPCHSFTHGLSEIDPAAYQEKPDFEFYVKCAMSRHKKPVTLETIHGVRHECPALVCVLLDLIPSTFRSSLQRKEYEKDLVEICWLEGEEIESAMDEWCLDRTYAAIQIQGLVDQDVVTWFRMLCPTPTRNEWDRLKDKYKWEDTIAERRKKGQK
jgi:hypothetical protein